LLVNTMPVSVAWRCQFESTCAWKQRNDLIGKQPVTWFEKARAGELSVPSAKYACDDRGKGAVETVFDCGFRQI